MQNGPQTDSLSLLRSTYHKIAGYFLGDTSLHTAVKAGDLETIRKLIAAGADIAATNRLGQTSLHLASNLGRLNSIELLLKAGANSNQKLELPTLRNMKEKPHEYTILHKIETSINFQIFILKSLLGISILPGALYLIQKIYMEQFSLGQVFIAYMMANVTCISLRTVGLVSWGVIDYSIKNILSGINLFTKYLGDSPFDKPIEKDDIIIVRALAQNGPLPDESVINYAFELSRYPLVEMLYEAGAPLPQNFSRLKEIIEQMSQYEENELKALADLFRFSDKINHHLPGFDLKNPDIDLSSLNPNEAIDSDDKTIIGLLIFSKLPLEIKWEVASHMKVLGKEPLNIKREILPSCVWQPG